MKNIGPYQIIQKLYAESPITVFQVKDPASGQPLILRLLDPNIDADQWYQLYAKYEGQITNYKYLPRWLTVDISKDNRVFSVLSGSGGQLLQRGQLLTVSQVDQLMDAVGHMHKKKFVHGNLKMENIWVGEDETITLYGAGENAAINQRERPTVKDDLQQLASVIESNSAIKTASPVSIDFTTIGELQDWLELQKSIAEKAEVPEIKSEPKRKPALVEKGELIEKSKHEKEKKKDRRTVVPEPEYVQPEKIEKKTGKRKVTSNLVWLVGIVMVFAIIWLVIWPGGASNTSQADTESEITKETNERDIKAADYADLFDGWEVIKQEDLPFVDRQFTVITAAKKTNDTSGVVKVAVLSHGNGEWEKIWESEKYSGHLSNPESYINSFMAVVSEEQDTALLVFDLPDGGSMGVAQVYALQISQDGKGEEVWNGFGFGIKKIDQVVSVKGVGITNLSLEDSEFAIEEIPRSEMAPEEAAEILFEVNQEGTVVPADKKELSLNIGDVLAFIPADEAVKNLFDLGEISIFTDVYSKGAPFSLANSNLLMHGNFIKFDKPGEFHIVLEYYNGPELDFNTQDYTFIVTVTDVAVAALAASREKSEKEAAEKKIEEAKNEVGQFFYDYNTKSVDAINTGDFTYVEDFLVFDGLRYNEQLAFIEDTFAKGITEEHLGTELKDITIMNEETWQITTVEDYIINGTEKRSEKKFKTITNIKVSDNDWLIDQLISTEVISSVEIASAAGEISSEDKSYIEEFFYNYNTASADAINSGNFYYVEPFLNYDGQFYDEQLNFVNDLYSKGIGEEHLSTELESVEIVNDEMWRVTTIEKFIIHGTQRSSEKTFRTITNLKLIGGEWLIDELISTTEI